MLKKIVAAVVVVAIAAIAYYGWTQRSATETETAAQETAVVRKDTLTLAVDATGSLAPATEMALAFGTSGRVAEVLVRAGDVVTKGQALARLDPRDLELALASAGSGREGAASSLAAAEASLEDLRAGPGQNEVDTAKVQLDQARDGRWGVQSQRDAVCGKVENKRAEQADCDKAQASVLEAEDAVRLAELKLAAVLAGPGAAELKAAEDKVKQARAQLASAENQVEQARLKREEAVLVAPMDGTVLAVDTQVGQQVGTTAAAITLGDLARLEVEVLLDQTDIGRIAVGQPASVVPTALPDTPLDGEVVRIAPLAETSSGVVLYPVTVRVRPSGEVPVRAGMTADVSIVTSREADALIVPRRAIQAENGKQFVEVVAGDGTSRRVPVTVGLSSDAETRVTTGLAEGDVVVVPAARQRETDTRFGGGLMGGPPP